jgi:hypothetical protein
MGIGMPQQSATTPVTTDSTPAEVTRDARTSNSLLTWSSLFFAVLQSVCGAFIALSGVRLLIGIGAFAAASSALRLADRMHIAGIRIPMMLFALIGSVLNLLALQRVWRLRRRSASAWRQQPVPAKKRRSEYLQFTISVLTLILLAVEVATHYSLFHRFF